MGVLFKGPGRENYHPKGPEGCCVLINVYALSLVSQ